MIKLIHKSKLLTYPTITEIPHELPYGFALEYALCLAQIMMRNGFHEYVHIVND